MSKTTEEIIALMEANGESAQKIQEVRERLEKRNIAKEKKVEPVGKTNDNAIGVFAESEEKTPVMGPAEETEESTDLELEDTSLELVNQVTDAYQRFKPTEEDKTRANEEAVSYISDLMDKSSQELPDVEDSMKKKVIFASKYSMRPTIMDTKSDEYLLRESEKAESTEELEELKSRAVKDLLDQYNSTTDVKIEEDTNEYRDWTESLNEGFIVNAMSNVKAKDINQSIFEGNLKDWAEDKDYLATVRGEEQVELETQTREALSVLNTKAKEQVGKSKVVEQNLLTLPKRYDELKSLNKSLKTINEKVSSITSKEYETQEEVDVANTEIESLQAQWDELNSAYEADGGLSYDELVEFKDNNVKAFKNISRNSEDIITKEEELNTYLDAVGRNYGGVTNLVGTLSSSIISTGSAGLELVEKLALDPAAGVINKLTGPDAPEWMQPLRYVPGAQKLLLASRTISEVTDLLDSVNEDILNGLEKPSRFSDIEDVEDFGEWFGHLVSSQAVNTAITFGTGGASLYILGGISAGTKFKEIDKEIAQGKKYTLTQQYVAAMGTGVIEGLSEKVTLGQANRVKALLRSNPNAKRGFTNVIKNNFSTRKGLYSNIYDPIEEGGTEMIAEFGANVMDKFVLGKEDTSLLEGLDEAFISGVFMSGLVYKSPLIGKNVIRAFQSSDATSQLESISSRIQDKTTMLGEVELSPENKTKVENDIKLLVEQHTKLMDETIVNIDKMDVEDKQTLINIDVSIASLKANNKSIRGEFGLTQEQIDGQVKENNDRISHLKALKNQTVAKASTSENQSRIERDTDKLDKEATKLFGKPVQITKVDDSNIEQQTEVYKKNELEAIDNKIKNKKAELKRVNKREDKVKVQEEIDELQEDRIATEAITSDTFKKVHGATAVHGDMILVNPEFAAKRGATNVISHEFMHQVLKNTLADNPAAAIAMGNAVDEILADLDPDKVAQSEMSSRLTAYADKPQSMRAEEKITLLMDAMKSGDIKINSSLGSKLKSPIRRILQSVGYKKADIELNNAQDVLNFITDVQASRNNIFLKNKAISKASQQGVKIGDKLLEGVKLEDDGRVVTKESLDNFYNELNPDDLVQIIKSPSTDAKQLVLAENALTKQFDLLALKALRYDTRTGDIAREDVLSAAREYLPGIIERFDPSKGFKFSTLITSNIAPKQAVIYEGAKSLFFGDTQSTDSEQAKQVADTQASPDTATKKVKPKTNVLKFTGVDKVLNKITSLVEVSEGDKFKEIISKYAGKVGELIFDVPAKKIMEGGANLVPTTKFGGGMAIPSEAQNIQRFFNAPQNTDKFIKTLPLYNVADMTADINELGENIDVSRDTYGVAVGLRGLPLDYFYEDYIDPRSKSKDLKTKAQSITSPKGRSKGLTTQPPVKKLKTKFINPTPETINKLKQDLGITLERAQPNNYNRDIGQLLKGVAKVYSINASLSAAQRFQEAKLEKATEGEKKAIKQQTADITAAQSKLAFSQDAQNLLQKAGGSIRAQFDLEFNGADKLIKNSIGDRTYKFDSKEDIDSYFGDVRRILIPIFPKGFISASLLRPSNRILPLKGGKIISVDGVDVTVDEYFTQQRDDMFSEDLNYGSDFTGAAKNWKAKTYGKVFGNSTAEFEKAKKDGTIDKFNKENGAMHKQMWQRINESIRANKNNAKVIGNFLKITSQKANHPHRLGAEFIGWSLKAKGSRGKKYEWEHAMPATSAYLYLLDASLNNLDFDQAYDLVMGNFKLIALDAAMDDKLKIAGLTTSMPANFDMLKNIWWERYFNKDVAKVDGGINPNSIVLTNGKTLSEDLNIKTDGNLAIIKASNEEIEAQKDLKKAKDNLVKFSKDGDIRGMSTFDFDETLIIDGENFVVATKGDKKQKIKDEADRLSELTYEDRNEVYNDDSWMGSGFTVAEDGELEGMTWWEVEYKKKKDLREEEGRKFLEAYENGDAKKKRELEMQAGVETVEISSSNWPIEGPKYAEQGYEFDFSDFANVRGGKEGPLIQKMKNQIKKYGNKNVFILTARQQASAEPIHQWLKSKGIDIPLENITGLGKSEGSAKGQWMLQKFAEGYNDMYFVDDALPNVKAVKDVLDQLDIKSKVVQAKINFSQDGSTQFNEMLERVAKVGKDKVFSAAQAKLRGAKIGGFKFFVPPSAEDFKGLLYTFLGKGKQGDADMAFFKEHLLDPFSAGIRNINETKQKMSNEYTTLRKTFPNAVKDLNKKVGKTDFTVDNAVRVYLWNQSGFEVPGMSKRDIDNLVEHVESNEELKAFADVLSKISRMPKGYVKPGDYWLTESIAFDLHNITSKINRSEFLAEWVENKDIIFSEENLNKIEAVYGTSFRNAIDDILFRMEKGTNKPSGNDKIVSNFQDWINGSVGAVMFFNTRSAALQTLSVVNFLDWQDNNLFKAAGAFANQPQYWKDFMTLFNSDMLKQRRAGMELDVNMSELMDSVSTAKVADKSKAAIRYLLQVGFTPTQIADSFAISAGGATFYRNKIKKYLKEGMNQKDAEIKAFDEFQEIAEETQQSSRPDFISQQQAGTLGRLILAWANTPMQYTRLTKKAISDLVNGRGDWRSHVSRILYYGAAQNFIFSSLQTGLAFALFGGDEEEEAIKTKELRVANGMMDTLLRGTGIYGAMASTLKNTILQYKAQSEKGYGKQGWDKVVLDMISLSPPIGSKVRKIMSAIKTYEYNKGVPEKMGWRIDNPMLSVVGNVVESITNFPLDRLVRKANNIDEAITGQHELWQRAALMLGWNAWSIGTKDEDVEEAKAEVKEDKSKASKERAEAKREAKKLDKQDTSNKESEDKKKEGYKTLRCISKKSDGSRCSIMVETKAKFAYCNYHKTYDPKKGSDNNGNGIKEYQCSGKTGSGSRCKNRTENKNKKCYAHQ